MHESWIAAVAVLAVGFGFWALMLIEAIGTWLFWPWVFALGPQIWSDERPAPPSPPLEVGTRVDTDSARFRIVAPGRCLFRRKYGPLRASSTFKGTLELLEGRVVARGRWPLGMVGFVAIWLVLWCGAGVWTLLKPAAMQNHTGIPLPVFVLAGPVFVFLLFGTMLWFERRLLRRAVDEFVARRLPT